MAHQNDSNDPETADPVPYDLDRLVPLVADGRVAFPTDLSAAEEVSLVAGVSERRRRRLVRFIAQAIARHLLAGAGPREGTPPC